MKIIVENIFKSFPTDFCLWFIGTCLNNTEHPTQGRHQLTELQLRRSPAEYKNKLYKNIVQRINLEIKFIQEDGGVDMSEPLVGGVLIKKLYSFAVDGSHDLNRRLKYPELMEIVDSIDVSKLSDKEVTKIVNEKTSQVESKMPYKNQFVFECLGYEV